ncbi:hypothetical protein MTR_8g046830 [Medicago truncatula]|uniref:Uncharacterized protein n=1 Tax=Medicago truncatula TaxID=3880 RepID=A0A072TRC0_MEDTR|nr:hypothetical protein MTR_8g046830 [Medicago truncatula]
MMASMSLNEDKGALFKDTGGSYNRKVYVYKVDLSTGDELEGESTGLNRESPGKEFLSFLAVESLNVSVATGVLLHHLIGKRSVDSLPDANRQISE